MALILEKDNLPEEDLGGYMIAYICQDGKHGMIFVGNISVREVVYLIGEKHNFIEPKLISAVFKPDQYLDGSIKDLYPILKRNNNGAFRVIETEHNIGLNIKG